MTEHNDRDHARFAPSAAHRWLVCPGSIKATENLPDRRSSAAEEGTECHEASANILHGLLTFAEATKDLSEEQVSIVEEYTDYVFGLIDRLSECGPIKVWVEEYVDAPKIHHEFGGTADFSILADRRLGVIDLKAGYHPVEVRLPNGDINPQLGSYAVLVVEKHKLWTEIEDVRITIVQPRVYTKPQHTIIRIDELEHFRKTLSAGIGRVIEGDETRIAGPHCKFCAARGRCPALRTLAREKAKIINWDGPPPDARNYETDELVAILNEAEVIDAHVQGVRAHVLRELEKGRMRGQGWKLVQKRPTYKWLDFEPVLKRLDGHFIYNVKPKTPLQIQKQLKELKIDFDISGLYEKVSSGVTLAREEDPREEFTPNPFGD